MLGLDMYHGTGNDEPETRIDGKRGRRIAIVGARVAGAYAGLLLSRLGYEVLLFDDSIEKEKPCGGGVTFKALRRMHWFHEHPLPHTEIASIRLMAHDGYASELPLPHPIHVFSRFSLDSCLRQWAVESGVHFRAERVLKVTAESCGWAIETSSGAIEADYLVGADGANSLVRNSQCGRFASADLCLALGYNLPGLYDPGRVLIRFQESGFHGYLWSFPRVDHSSVGIGRWLPEAHGSDLRDRVDAFISEHYPDVGSEKRYYAARIPCLGRKSLLQQRVCGPGWAILGDAAGFTDAITSEGIYYALRSAELLAESFQRGDPSSYERAWRSDFRADLESAAVWRDRFYGSMVLAQTFIRRSLQSVRHSHTVRGLLDGLIGGNLTYSSMFRNLVFRSPTILLQMVRDKAAARKSNTNN
jgi:flavin-dependent dehydrogenase